MPRVAPFGPPRIKAVRKSQKHYHFDWTTIEDRGARFENLIGFHLLKECHYREDVEGRDAELRFFRDVTGREVDFVQLVDRKPVRFVECKVADTAISPALLYLHRKFPGVPALQVLETPRVDRLTAEGVRILIPNATLMSEVVLNRGAPAARGAGVMPDSKRAT